MLLNYHIGRFVSWFAVCWRLGWSIIRAAACNPDTTPAEPHLISNTQQTTNETTNVIIQQHTRKLLMMSILMPETC